MTAYNRGQVLYRVAEMMEGRRAEFAELTGDEAEVDAAIDRWVWYAGWADKLAQVLGASNPVAGPYFNFTIPEPTGVVGDRRARGAGRSPASSRASRPRRRRERRGRRSPPSTARSPRSRWPRCSPPRTSPAASSTSSPAASASSAPVLAAHMDVNALDLAGAGDDLAELERLAADNVKRVARNGEGQSPVARGRLPRAEDRLAPDRRLSFLPP